MDNLLGTFIDLDETVEVTVNWIEENGGWEENLLIVTADHDHYMTLTDDFPALYREQGGEALTLAFDSADAGHYFGSNPDDKYEWGNHSNRPVPVYYQGAGSEVLDGFIGEGFESYGVEVPGIPDHVDLVHLAQTARTAILQEETPEPPLLPVFGSLDGETIEAGSDELVFGGAGDDLIDSSAGGGGNRLYGQSGDDQFVLGSGDRALGAAGDDSFFFLGGDTTVTGGNGADQFWIVTAEIPDEANIVTDFDQVEADVLGKQSDINKQHYVTNY